MCEKDERSVRECTSCRLTNEECRADAVEEACYARCWVDHVGLSSTNAMGHDDEKTKQAIWIPDR